MGRLKHEIPLHPGERPVAVRPEFWQTCSCASEHRLPAGKGFRHVTAETILQTVKAASALWTLMTCRTLTFAVATKTQGTGGCGYFFLNFLGSGSSGFICLFR
jgi:hypothetical protein